MSVVLRCANCGTTQGHAGECEACSEGEVQYFCTDHGQGIWLDGPVCSRCGGTFGDTPSRPAPPPVPAGRAGPADFRAPARRRTPERPREPEFGRRPPRRPDPDDVADPETVRPGPSLGELLEEITEARARGGAPFEVDEAPWTGLPRRGIGFPVAGCLLRLLGLGFLLLVAFVVFLFLLFGGLIGG